MNVSRGYNATAEHPFFSAAGIMQNPFSFSTKMQMSWRIRQKKKLHSVAGLRPIIKSPFNL